MRSRYIIGIIALVLVAGVWFYLHTRGLRPLFEAVDPTEAHRTAGMPIPSSTSSDLMDFKSDKLHFFISYPKSLGQVSDTDEGDGSHTIVFTDGKDRSFQIYVTPYSKSQITKEQFAADEPSSVMKDATEVLIDGVRAQHFTGHDETIGDTSEVWFIHNGFLYEVVTFKRLDTWLADIMKTWKFI
jgi:hypothetical protein